LRQQIPVKNVLDTEEVSSTANSKLFERYVEIFYFERQKQILGFNEGRDILETAW